MSWSDRTISYPNTSGSCAISGDGSVIAYGVTGGSDYINNGVTILSDVGKVTESSVYIQTATGGFAGYGLSLDFAGTQFVTTTIYGSGNGIGGAGYGYLYTRGPNLYESYGNVVSSGPMVATSFSGDVKSHFVSVTSSQIWSGIQNLSFTGFGIAWSNELGLFVSVGGFSTSFVYSFDGITWTPSPSVVAYYFNDVTWSKDLGLFVAVSVGNISAKSSDGITWTSSSIGGGGTNWQGVTWAQELGLFLAVGYFVQSAYSTNGSSWNVAGNLDNTVNWRSVAWSPKLLLFVAVGDNTFSTSPDGTNWTPNAFGSGYNWFKIIWSPERELFVAVGDGDSFAYSSDGLSWTRGSFGVAFSTRKAITWAREVNTFVAFSTDGYASYSADGINWTTPLLVNSGFNALSIAWSPQNGRFVSTGYENFIYLNVGTLKSPALLANYVSANYLLGDGSSISNIQASSIVQPFANLVVSNSVTTTNVFATTYHGDGGLLSNINSFVQPLANLVVSNSVTTTNVFAYDANVANTIWTSNLVVSNIFSNETTGNTYVQGNVVVSGNVYSSLGQLGVGGSLLFSLGTPYTPSTYTGTIPNAGTTTNKIRLDSFTQQGASTYISTSANGCFQFTQSGVYTICSNFLTNFNNILGIGIGSNVIDYGTRTDQTYLYSIIPFISQNPTAVLEAQIYVSDLTKYYYIDAFSVDGVTLQPTSSVNGGTWISIAPLGGVAQTITLGTLGNTVTGRATNYGAQLTDYYIGCTAGITVTLPLGATLTAGKQYVIKDESGTAAVNHITIQPYTGNLIDGQTSLIFVINYGAVTLYWTGATWSIV